MQCTFSRQLPIVTALSVSFFSVFTFITLLNALLVDMSREFGVSIGAIAQLGTIGAISWALAALLIGPVADRVGTKRMILIGSIFFSVSMMGFGFAPNVKTLVVAAIGAGVAGAAVGPNVLASVDDYFSPHVHGRIMAIVTSAVPIANLVGAPGLMIVAGRLGWRWSYYSLALIALAGIPAVFLALPTTPLRAKHPRGAYASSFVLACRDRSFIPVIVANTALQATFYVVATYVAAFLMEKFALHTAAVAPLLSGMAIGQLVGTLVGGPLADRFDRIKLCAFFSILLGVLGFVFVRFVTHAWLSVIWAGLFMALHSLSRPAFYALVLQVAPHVRGTVMGIQATSNHLGRALGAAIGGIGLSWFGYDALALLCLVIGAFTTATYGYVMHVGRAAGRPSVTVDTHW